MVACGCCGKHEEDEDHLTYDSDEDKGKPDKKWRVPNFADQHNLKHNKHQLSRVRKVGRLPTDVPCCLLFVAYCLGMIAIAGLSFWQGDPRRLYLSTDYMGRVCGRDNSYTSNIFLPFDEDCKNYGKSMTISARCEEKVRPYKVDLSDRPYCYYMDLTNPIEYGCTCVSYCPGSVNKTQNTQATVDQTTRAFCPPQLVTNSTSYAFGLIDATYCATPRADTNYTLPATELGEEVMSAFTFSPVLRRCIPIPNPQVDKTQLLHLTKLGNNSAISSLVDEGMSVASDLFGDLVKTWKVMVLSVFVAIAIAFLFLVVVRIFAPIIIVLSTLLCFVALVIASALLIWEGLTQRTQLAAKGLGTAFGDAMLGIGIALAILTAIYVLVVIIMFIRIRRAVAIIQQACKAIAAMPQIIFVPLISSLLYVVFVALWVLVAVFIWSSGTPKIVGGAVQYNLTKWMQGILAYHLFGGLWISSFVLHASWMIVAGAVAQWYWRRDKRFFMSGAVLNSVKRTILFHLGTIAFASLLVAIIQFIRIVFEKAQREVRTALTNNKIAKALIWAARVFLFLVEWLIKFLNKHAIIQTAMYGTGFFTSSRNSFNLILRNPLQIAVLDTIGNSVIFIGNLAIAIATTVIAYGLSKVSFLVEDADTIFLPILMLVIVFVMSFVIGSMFMNVLDTAIDTILQAFLVDNEICSDDADAKPYATGSLKRIIQENQTRAKAERCVVHLCCCITGPRGGYGAKKAEDAHGQDKRAPDLVKEDMEML